MGRIPRVLCRWIHRCGWRCPLHAGDQAGAYRNALSWPAVGRPVPANATPLFVAAATDDSLGLAPANVALQQKWIAAGKPAELHMYAKGRHGFRMKDQKLPTDHWVDRFTDWLQLEGFLEQ